MEPTTSMVPSSNRVLFKSSWLSSCIFFFFGFFGWLRYTFLKSQYFIPIRTVKPNQKWLFKSLGVPTSTPLRHGRAIRYNLPEKRFSLLSLRKGNSTKIVFIDKIKLQFKLTIAECIVSMYYIATEILPLSE
jgi:hypothetical protein